MTTLFSTRLKQSTVNRIGVLSRRLNRPKNKVIEDAVDRLCGETEHEYANRVLKDSFGAWQRQEPPAGTVVRVRKAITKAFARTHT